MPTSVGFCGNRCAGVPSPSDAASAATQRRQAQPTPAAGAGLGHPGGDRGECREAGTDGLLEALGQSELRGRAVGAGTAQADLDAPVVDGQQLDDPTVGADVVADVAVDHLAHRHRQDGVARTVTGGAPLLRDGQCGLQGGPDSGTLGSPAATGAKPDTNGVGLDGQRSYGAVVEQDPNVVGDPGRVADEVERAGRQHPAQLAVGPGDGFGVQADQLAADLFEALRQAQGALAADLFEALRQAQGALGAQGVWAADLFEALRRAQGAFVADLFGGLRWARGAWGCRPLRGPSTGSGGVGRRCRSRQGSDDQPGEKRHPPGHYEHVAERDRGPAPRPGLPAQRAYRGHALQGVQEEHQQSGQHRCGEQRLTGPRPVVDGHLLQRRGRVCRILGRRDLAQGGHKHLAGRERGQYPDVNPPVETERLEHRLDEPAGGRGVAVVDHVRRHCGGVVRVDAGGGQLGGAAGRQVQQ